MATAHVGDIELYYEEHGSGDPLLLVMGLAADSQAWMFQLPELSKKYRTVVFDNRGVGRSSKPLGPYTTAAMADDAVGLLDVLGIERAHVVGVSMGGMIAQEIALRHPERVRGLVLACTYGDPGDDIAQIRSGMVTRLGGSTAADGSLAIDAMSIDPMSMFQELMPRVFNPDYLQRELPTLIQIFSGAMQWGISMEAILAQVQATVTHDCSTRLASIASPTMVLSGDSDRLIPPSNSERLAKRIPNAKLVFVKGGSHAFNFETPDVFNAHVLEFLDSVRN